VVVDGHVCFRRHCLQTRLHGSHCGTTVTCIVKDAK
jgi:hypothetical protein